MGVAVDSLRLQQLTDEKSELEYKIKLVVQAREGLTRAGDDLLLLSIHVISLFRFGLGNKRPGHVRQVGESFGRGKALFRPRHVPHTFACECGRMQNGFEKSFRHSQEGVFCPIQIQGNDSHGLHCIRL